MNKPRPTGEPRVGVVRVRRGKASRETPGLLRQIADDKRIADIDASICRDRFYSRFFAAHVVMSVRVNYR